MATKSRKIVVIDGSPSHDWVALFQGKTLANGSPLHIVQCSWIETGVSVDHDQGCYFTAAPIRESEGKVTRPSTITVVPDFVLVRNQVRGPTPSSDCRNVLYGLLAANVPSINSLQSLLMDLERPVTYGALRAIEKRLGHDKFPLIPQNYFSGHEMMSVFEHFPAVLKVSHAHRGMGKAKLEDYEALRDLRTVVALHSDYATLEPFIKNVTHGLRIQKIGTHYRTYKVEFTGGGWKSQFGGSDQKEIPTTPEFKSWIDEACQVHGGLELCALDVLLNSKNEHWILELNGSAIGIPSEDWKEDSLKIVDMVIERMNQLYSGGKVEKKQVVSASAAEPEPEPKGKKDKKDKKEKEKKNK